jgi:hypothetical protein
LYCYGCGASNSDKSVADISADDILSITIVQLPDGKPVSCPDNEIRSFVKAFNKVTLYRNDVGTTPPYRVEVTFRDGSTLIVWGYTQGFATMKKGTDDQQNIRGFALRRWFARNSKRAKQEE